MNPTSSPFKLPLSLSLAGVFLAVLSACPNNAAQTKTGCEIDGDCAINQICDAPTGFCLCANDEACDASEFCNALGRCQPFAGCQNNDDCRTPDRPIDFCDVLTSTCLTPNASSLQCTLDSHCPFGSKCTENICVPGCTDNGDCRLGDPCISGQCDTRAGACNNDSYCNFGESCNTTTLTCTPHRQAATLCQRCDPQDILNQACGTGTCLIDSSVVPTVCSSDSECAGHKCVQNPCLMDTDCAAGETCADRGIFLPGHCSVGHCGDYFCGSDTCNADSDPCPRGYTCYDLISVSGNPCTLGDNTCTDGRVCQAGGENVAAGYCSCIDNSDCGLGQECVDPGPNGRCLQGRTCGPDPGLLCQNVLP